MTLLYLDANIFINIINDEKNTFGEDLAKSVVKLLFNAINCKYHLAISTWTLQEVNHKVKDEQIQMIFQLIKKKVIPIKYDETEKELAKQRSPNNWNDALHIILAEKIKADVIVTRNISDFIKIGTKISLKRPENV